MALSRRELLISTLGVAAAAGCTSPNSTAQPTGQESSNAVESAEVAPPPTRAEPRLIAPPPFNGGFPFGLGVASGDPNHNSVVLWTRLIGDGVDANPTGDHAVAVDVARDAAFDDLVLSMLADAPGAHGNSVHVIPENLDPATWYYYRFRIGEHTSAVGRTRTTPNPGSDSPPLAFGFSSCQNWESGAYAAHRHLAELELDLFIWLGDYIYEYGPGNSGDVSSAGQRVHDSPEVTDLAGYRQRYALYKSDSDLQDHHAARPWIVTWDDHEVDNNHAGDATEDGQPPDDFATRRASAYQAWWEHMPVRLDPPTPGADYVIYRSIEWGDLVDIHMLDGRQFRSPQVTDGDPVALPGLGNIGVQLLGNGARNPEQTMLGSTQRQWLENQVQSSVARWNVLGNQVYMHGLNAFPGDVPAINTDAWDGYFGEREALLNEIGSPAANLVVLSGDFHSSTAADLRSDPYNLSGPILATEFMAPAISSTFPDALRDLAPLALLLNPQIKNFSPENGFMTCEVTSDLWTTRLHVLDDVTDRDSAVTLSATFTVEAGSAGIASVS